MQLIEIFLPLFDKNEQAFDSSLYDELSILLKEKFGGVTFYRNSPAEGLWKDGKGKTKYDELIIAEVMVSELDTEWWQQLKDRLEKTFQQKEILIRAFGFEKL